MIEVGDSYYNSMFDAFLHPEYNEQYRYMQLLEYEFFSALQQRYAKFSPDHPLKLIDLCCGEGSNAPVVLRSIKDATAVSDIWYIAADIQDVSIRKMSKLLLSLKKDGVVSEESRVLQADIFNNISLFPGDADVVRLSHGLYYMQTDVEGNSAHLDPAVGRFIRDVMSKIHPHGFFVLFHETAESDFFSPQFTYSRQDGTIIPKMTDAAERIEVAAKREGYKICAVNFSPKLYFPELSTQHYNELCAIAAYPQLDALNEAQQRWVKLLLFAVQPPKSEFSEFISSGKFMDYVQKMHRLLQENPRKKGENPYLYIHQSMQIIVKDAKEFERMQAICTGLQENLPLLQIQE